MKPYDTLRQGIIEKLEEFEESQRRYLDKVDKDRPWVGRAHWQAVWDFRKRISEDFDVLAEQLRLAQFTKDPP